MRAFGGMISVELSGALDDARRFLERCRLFALAESLGGVESLAELPALMTHSSVSAEVRAGLGISDTLVRLSVGIEDSESAGADTMYKLGRAYENLGDYARAAKCYEHVTAFEGHPLYYEAREGIERVSRTNNPV